MGKITKPETKIERNNWLLSIDQNRWAILMPSDKKKLKIVLYNPRAVFYTMPLALMALASALDRDKYEAVLIDARLEKNPQKTVLEHIQNAFCFGTTILTGAPIIDALKVTEMVKQNNSNITTIWGGWHSSLFPLGPLEATSVDISVQGQGEQTFKEIVERLANGECFDDVQGIAHRPLGLPMKNEKRALIAMNDFPEVDYETIPVKSYFELKGKRQLDYISSTGCLFRCAFCADPFVYGRKWSAIEPKRMTEHLFRLWKRYDFDDVNFQDETFFTYTKRTEEISERLISLGTDFTWAATLRGDQGSRMTDKQFELCKKSGLRRVMVGVESGSPKMLKQIAKDVTIDQILETAEKCIRHDIDAIFPFIIGFPGETDDDVMMSIEMVKTLRSMSPRFETPIFYYKPYPGLSLDLNGHHTGYSPPTTLSEWAKFDFIGSTGPWVREHTYKMVERFKFYNRYAWGSEKEGIGLLRNMSRWRCNNNNFKFPLEKAIIERIFPQQELS